MYELSRDEACLICDALYGIALLAHDEFLAPNQILLAKVEDAIRLNRLDLKWSVDRNVLFGKLGWFDRDQARSLVAAVAHFWERTDLPTDEALRVAGLIE